VKNKAHTVYKLKDGTRVPGASTITGELAWNKQVLMNWAFKLGKEGNVDSMSAFVDDKAAIGTLGHLLVQDHFGKKKTDTSDYTKNQIDQAENCLMSYWNWEKGKTIEPILLETPLVSETLCYGGTMDFYGKVDGKLTLLDFKTGKGIYDEYLIQTSAYAMLLEENGHFVDCIQILNIPRSEGESFQVEVLPVGKWDVCRKIFLNCLNNYNLKKQLEKE